MTLALKAWGQRLSKRPGAKRPKCSRAATQNSSLANVACWHLASFAAAQKIPTRSEELRTLLGLTVAKYGPPFRFGQSRRPSTAGTASGHAATLHTCAPRLSPVPRARVDLESAQAAARSS